MQAYIFCPFDVDVHIDGVCLGSFVWSWILTFIQFYVKSSQFQN